mgnify:CR=1 FL=1
MNFEQEDERFVSLAADAGKRTEALVSLCRMRRRFFLLAAGCSLAFCLALVAVIWNPSPASLGLVGGGCFGTLAVWQLFFKLDSDIKLLKVARRLCGEP